MHCENVDCIHKPKSHTSWIFFLFEFAPINITELLHHTTRSMSGCKLSCSYGSVAVPGVSPAVLCNVCLEDGRDMFK